MTDFDALQAAIERYAHERQAEQRACEAFLNALYHALRSASGPGLPLNNVAMEPVADSQTRLRPPPPGSWHAVWLRLGLCEVLVRVRRDAGAFVGEYGQSSAFRLTSVGENDLLVLARRLLRDVAASYAGGTNPSLTGTRLN
ncbi:hypothetical protein [Deinococcus hopiensis]|uniref:Uncharacterized protein n=1 Tax=Deinococcus hopiensis KR-140 TaxID=695939 RepID=A0A1W1VCR4_9DEIO|nr:hypothetical protein [Deinococcus hopiensis]SMB91115.1 hypothetical protein SAMN00790413_00991 [Deinococcus hopiensis KR-140]